MKRYCKNINICDVNTIFPYVYDCCHRHKSRNDFRQLFLSHGISKDEYNCMNNGDMEILSKVVINICKDAITRIQNRELNLPPVTIKERVDTTTGKIRQIGRECAMQQVFDYIAVYGAMDVFKARMVIQQCSSIPNRGQIYGKNIISKWYKKDCESKRYAIKHNYHYTSKHKYFCKLDIKKCYPNAKSDIFMDLFKKDCANTDLLWLWEALLNSHKVDGYSGFMIGSLPSQWAAQYMISFIYRYGKNLHYTNHGKSFKCINGLIMFMDDILVTGSNRKQLLKAIKYIIKYTKNCLGWDIKPNWHIRDINKFSVDMMGFVIHKNGKTAIRSRNFIKLRRLALRILNHNYKATIKQAKRLSSYKGFVIFSNNLKIVKKYKLLNVFNNIQHIISLFDKGVSIWT